jgi:hypothetical protein
MYNGYNYYPPSNGSNATSPVYLMPYPYQYDPFFMTPGGIHPTEGDETDEKTETDGAKENNQNAENQNVSWSTFIVRRCKFESLEVNVAIIVCRLVCLQYRGFP